MGEKLLLHVIDVVRMHMDLRKKHALGRLAQGLYCARGARSNMSAAVGASRCEGWRLRDGENWPTNGLPRRWLARQVMFLRGER
jgi:hypothetical protein